MFINVDLPAPFSPSRVDGQADILVGVKITKPLADMLHTQQLAQVPSLPFVHVFAEVVVFHLENDNRPRSVLKY